MRRAKLGDVYAMRLNNGIKIFQWAYQIPKYGTFVRVFPGLYDAIPMNIAEIVEGEHSYIIDFFVSRAYRIGLVEFLENLPVPEKYRTPMYTIHFVNYELTDNFGAWVSPSPFDTSENCRKKYLFQDLKSIKDLPGEYQNVRWLDGIVSPDWLMYLFDYDFTFDNPRRFWPGYVLGEKADEILGAYWDRVQRLLEADRAKRKSKKESV